MKRVWMLFATAVATCAPGAERDDHNIEEVTILGVADDLHRLGGAAHFVDAETLARLAYTDVQRIMRAVPGVSIQVEDGYGLRPNIGIRGTATERSARITLLEDGVLIAPAPYSAPAAYYFPTAGRMAAFEILKGPAAVTEGPYTVGGALNMVSTPIPAARAGRLFVETGEHATHRLHATYGGASGGFGYLLETHQWFSNGYQSVDRAGASTGLDVRDYTVKFSYEQAAHRMEVKAQQVAQTSRQSYLGLTEADFRADPDRRYGLSQLDRIDTDHEQLVLRYRYRPSAALEVAATAYENRHARNWFKTEGIDLDGSAAAESLERVGWANIVQAVNLGRSVRGVSPQMLAGVLAGRVDTPPGSIQMRANDRKYMSRGVQVEAAWEVETRRARFHLRLGLRHHEDEEDRLQRNSAYSQRDGALVLDDIGLLGNAGNRIQNATALAAFATGRLEIGPWTLAPGVRFEDISQSRTRYEIRQGRTDDPSSRAPENLRGGRANETRVALPGLGVSYQIRDRATFLAGVYKGFSAPSNAPGVDAEEALNYEFGVRLANQRWRLEAIGFVSDYDNLLGVCTASSGVECEVGDAFNGDAATVKGLELVAGVDFGADRRVGMPVDLVYTWMDGRFDTDIADTAFFGDVSAGDPIPYLPEHQLAATIGVTGGRWSGHLSANFVAGACARAACGAFEATDDALTFDAAARFNVSDQASVFARVENLGDARDIVGRHPYGARPNKGRTLAVGVEFLW